MVLKKDLQAIRACKSAMSEAEQKYYRENFGSYPPPMPDSITNQIWQHHMRPWKEGSGNRAGQMTEKEEAALLRLLLHGEISSGNDRPKHEHTEGQLQLSQDTLSSKTMKTMMSLSAYTDLIHYLQ